MSQDQSVDHDRPRGPCLALLIAACVIAGTAASVGHAEDTLDAAVRACAKLHVSLERLACYDRKVAPLAEPGTTQPAAASEEMFGIDSTAPAPAEEPAAAREDLAEITAKVTNTTTVGRSFQIELDNGQVWRTDDDRELLLKPGDSVTIARATLGTFRLTTSTHRTARVKRVR